MMIDDSESNEAMDKQTTEMTNCIIDRLIE